MKVANKEILAMHVKDLASMLQRRNMIDDLNKGLYQCTECSRTLALNNLGSMRQLEGNLVFTCNDPLCYYNVISKRSTINNRT